MKENFGFLRRAIHQEIRISSGKRRALNFDFNLAFQHNCQHVSRGKTPPLRLVKTFHYQFARRKSSRALPCITEIIHRELDDFICSTWKSRSARWPSRGLPTLISPRSIKTTAESHSIFQLFAERRPNPSKTGKLSLPSPRAVVSGNAYTMIHGEGETSLFIQHWNLKSLWIARGRKGKWIQSFLYAVWDKAIRVKGCLTMKAKGVSIQRNILVLSMPRLILSISHWLLSPFRVFSFRECLYRIKLVLCVCVVSWLLFAFAFFRPEESLTDEGNRAGAGCFHAFSSFVFFQRKIDVVRVFLIVETSSGMARTFALLCFLFQSGDL